MGPSKIGNLLSNGTAINRDAEKDWMSFNDRISAKLLEINKQKRPVVFAQRHVISNVNSVQLSSILKNGFFFPAAQIEPSQIPDTVEDYKHWLAQNKNACVYVANTSQDWQFVPAPTYKYLEEAFRQEGLVETASLPLPDGLQNMVLTGPR